MIDAYVTLIIEDEAYTLKNVPRRYQKEVKVELEKRGYDENGNLITDEQEAQ